MKHRCPQKTEDRGIHADADCDGNNDDRSQTWSAEERAKGVFHGGFRIADFGLRIDAADRVGFLSREDSVETADER
jgi:hypothetical protein